MDIKKKFLIIRLTAIGDIIHCLPVAYAIKEKYPNAQIDWVVSDKCYEILKNCPVINNLWVANLSKWRKNWLSCENIAEIRSLNEKIRNEKYDYSIDLQGMFKSLVIQAFSGAKYRVGYRDYREFSTLGCNLLVKPRSKRPHRNYHIIQRNLDLLEGSGILTSDELKNIVPAAKLAEANLKTKEIVDNLLFATDKSKATIVFAPATTWSNKHWNVKNWQKLYYSLKDKVNILFTGIQKDIDLINEITKNDNSALILAGKTNLMEYIEILRRADMVISPDSSASHIAWSVGCQNIITIFCATGKQTFAPIGKIAFPKGKEVCVPCYKKKCKNPICTSQTTADEVLETIYNILQIK